MTDPVLRAVELLRKTANIKRKCHCIPPDYTDWNDELDAKRDHDEMLRIADALASANRHTWREAFLEGTIQKSSERIAVLERENAYLSDVLEQIAFTSTSRPVAAGMPGPSEEIQWWKDIVFECIGMAAAAANIQCPPERATMSEIPKGEVK